MEEMEGEGEMVNSSLSSTEQGEWISSSRNWWQVGGADCWRKGDRYLLEDWLTGSGMSVGCRKWWPSVEGPRPKPTGRE